MAVSGHIVFSTAMYIIGESFYSTTPGYHASSCGFESGPCLHASEGILMVDSFPPPKSSIAPSSIAHMNLGLLGDTILQ